MAIRAIMARHKLDRARKALDELKKREDEFKTREAELEQAVTESETEEQDKAVEDTLQTLEQERTAWRDSVRTAEDEVSQLEEELRQAEAEQGEETPEDKEGHEMPEERNGKTMNMRTIRAFGRMNETERSAFVQRDEVKGYLESVRGCIREKRALTNVGLTIPEVMLGLLKENIGEYSKLLKHVNVIPVAGEGRQLVMGEIPEAIWTECCKNLNELDLKFNDLELDCYMVAGYFAVCNANIEDSDIDLAGELLDALGAAIGKAIDKAILYGRKDSDTMKMPQGIATRLLQTEQPANYGTTQRTWVDLHTSNVHTINATGASLFAALAVYMGSAKAKYARSEIVHVMNETTYAYITGQAVGTDATGAIVARVNGTMPVIGGKIEILDFVPDYNIISGYFDLYTLAERAGAKFAQSEHVRFLQNQTVFKGVARYDGAPAIAEAFVLNGINNTSPAATGVTFGTDDANSVQAIALNTSTLAITGTATKQLIAITSPGSGPVTWASSASGKATVDSNGLVTGVTAGTTTITATANGLTASCVVTVT